MYDDEYDFLYLTEKPFYKRDKIKRMVRSAYLRFDCPNCCRPNNRKRSRRWTTVCGTVERDNKTEGVQNWGTEAPVSHHGLRIKGNTNFLRRNTNHGLRIKANTKFLRRNTNDGLRIKANTSSLRTHEESP